MQSFMRRDVGNIDWIPFDIETTGLKATDEVTALCLYHNDVYHLWLQAPNGIGDEEELVEDIEDASNLSIELHAVESELLLLSWVNSFISDEINKEDSVITAYNGEKWKGGFDIKFLRTRAARHAIDVPFKDCHYTDPFEVFADKDRFNTTVADPTSLNKTPKKSFCQFIGLDDSGTHADLDDRLAETDYTTDDMQEWADEHNGGDVPVGGSNDLGGVHELLVQPNLDDDWEDYDPFEDSAKAVTCFEEENYLDLALHVLADVEKTVNLTDLMLDYAPKYEYRPKTL